MKNLQGRNFALCSVSYLIKVSTQCFPKLSFFYPVSHYALLKSWLISFKRINWSINYPVLLLLILVYFNINSFKERIQSLCSHSQYLNRTGQKHYLLSQHSLHCTCTLHCIKCRSKIVSTSMYMHFMHIDIRHITRNSKHFVPLELNCNIFLFGTVKFFADM